MDEKVQPKPKKRFYHQDPSMGNKNKAPNKNSQGGVHTFERSRCATCRKQHLGKCLDGTDGFFVCGNTVQNMRKCPNIKERGRGHSLVVVRILMFQGIIISLYLKLRKELIRNKSPSKS